MPLVKFVLKSLAGGAIAQWGPSVVVGAIGGATAVIEGVPFPLAFFLFLFLFGLVLTILSTVSGRRGHAREVANPRSASDRDEVADGTGHMDAGSRRIIGKVLVAERIRLGWDSYIDCTFRDCTFVWNGIRSWSFQGCRLEGTIRLEAPNGPVAGTIDLLKFFGFLRPDFASEWKHLPDEHFKQDAP